MSAPNAQELTILPKFRERLADLKLEDDSDIFLLKWLRARELNLNQAEDMLRKSLVWRAENQIDSVLSWTPPEFLLSNYPLDISGFDNNNSPIALIPFGKWDLKKMISVGHKSDYIRYIDQLFEQVLSQMDGKVTSEKIKVTQFIVIFDMDGLAMSTLASKGAIEAVLENVRRFESNYPETLKTAFVINASRVFTLLFALIKPLLSQRTFGKVQIFNNNALKWQRAIFEAIPRAQLSKSLGGTSSSSPINFGDQTEDGELKTVTIGAGSTLPLAFQVDIPGTVLSWTFKTQNYDIGYSIILDGRIGRIVETGQRVESSSKWFEGEFVCDEVGVYIFNFDNSFSRLRSKTVNYKIKLIQPEE